MSNEQGEPRRTDSAALFSTRLNDLFDARLNPATGQRYTLREVSEATGGVLGISYISALRRGQIAMPPADRVQLLADVFRVDIGYFFGKSPPAQPDGEESAEQVELRRALADPTVSSIALRAGRLGPAERELVMQTLEWAERRSRRDRDAEVVKDAREE
jgi:transcriptional regulator with XRE-family HTH domain